MLDTHSAKHVAITQQCIDIMLDTCMVKADENRAANLTWWYLQLKVTPDEGYKLYPDTVIYQCNRVNYQIHHSSRQKISTSSLISTGSHLTH